MGDNFEYLKVIAASYPTVHSVRTELINLNAILNLPKGTEHFVSDIHGEYEAFQHIMNNCSGVIREKVEGLFTGALSARQRSELCTLIYYPVEKMTLLKERQQVNDTWYLDILQQLIALCKVLSSKYTRSKVRKALPKEYSYIIDELLHASPDEDANQKRYHYKILETIISTRSAENFIVAISDLIKVLAVDKLHVVGDIYDRGPNPDKVMETLMKHHNVDIQWGNHDILWMGAAAGSEACIATAIRNNVVAGNYEFLESGYGISLRPLALYAKNTYPNAGSVEAAIIKAISIILFKLEAQIIKRNPAFQMQDRLLLDKIDYQESVLVFNGQTYPLDRNDFITVNPASPETLTGEEKTVLGHLRKSFANSKVLHRQIRFLYQHGSIYKCYNQNLLYHGCVPLNPDGTFAQLTLGDKPLSGKALLDEFEQIAVEAYFNRKTNRPFFAQDCMWYLWCGRLSPLFGREKMTTFERMFIREKATHVEEKNAYYALCEDEAVCAKILQEFGLCVDYSRIINGHEPVKVSEGETPVKANGHLFFIDGGFCRAYQKTTGIAGYTLIYNSHGIRILSHRPFQGIEAAIQNNDDIVSNSDLIETSVSRIMVMDTDGGNEISNKVYLLSILLDAYRTGRLIPQDSQMDLQE